MAGGNLPLRSLRTVRDSLPSYGSHSPAFFCLGRSVGSSPEGLTSNDRELPGPFAPTPLQGPHRYYEPVRPCAPHRYSRTRSVCCLWFSLLRPKTPAVSIGATGSPCSMPAPAMSSRHLYTGHRRGHIQAAPRLRAHRRRAFVPGPPTDPSFDAIVVSFRCVSSGSHMFCLLTSHTPPATTRRQPQRSPAPALDRRSRLWGDVSRSRSPHHWHSTDRPTISTSSSLPFRTHVGAETRRVR